MAESPRQPARRLLVIHNPAAGRWRRRRLKATLDLLARAGCEIRLAPTNRPGEAAEIAGRLAGDAVDVVVAAGGDGTVNEVINGLMAAPAPRPALAFLPLGTANVLAAEIGLPCRPAAIARCIAAGRRRPVHLGIANGRHFLLMVGVGLDAHAVASVDLGLKRYGGKFAYVVSTALELFRYRFPVCRVEIDGTPHEARGAVVFNGRFYAGPFVAAPKADLAAPGFEVMMMRGAGLWNALRYGWALLRGRLPRLPDVAVVTGSRITITGEDGAPVQADGDIVTRLPVAIQVAEDTLDLMTP